ncbi:hypothetical protein SAMN05444280_13911 [Tangfeifania diversioriginum]|uniref:Uncharacterized protein n=1 Tax=Tangfeifania diversioriginum TaxID=1168035 RepID=A0A1M6N3Y1_9BACT|nr:hypothetical protein SAMN05444280_13911 [Tangfeifania diversioriginum]
MGANLLRIAPIHWVHLSFPERQATVIMAGSVHRFTVESGPVLLGLAFYGVNL